MFSATENTYKHYWNIVNIVTEKIISRSWLVKRTPSQAKTVVWRYSIKEMLFKTKHLCLSLFS